LVSIYIGEYSLLANFVDSVDDLEIGIGREAPGRWRRVVVRWSDVVGVVAVVELWSRACCRIQTRVTRSTLGYITNWPTKLRPCD
jgi:hypothetical protein